MSFKLSDVKKGELLISLFNGDFEVNIYEQQSYGCPISKFDLNVSLNLTGDIEGTYLGWHYFILLCGLWTISGCVTLLKY